MGAEAGLAEVGPPRARGLVAPRVPASPSRGLVPGRCLLPLRLRREARAVCAGEGIGLEPGHVDDGLVGVQRRPSVDPPLAPSGRATGPAPRVGDVVVLLPGPALVAPPLAPLVAAALGEGEPARVGHRRAADPEGGELGPVAGALVVVGEAEAAGADRARAAGHLDRLEA